MSTDRASLLRLRAEVDRDLDAATRLLEDLALRAPELQQGDPVLLGYGAITLHRIYTAVETACERICRTLEDTLPAGRDSHQALLADMTLDLPGLRPPVLRQETARELQTLLRFRHFVRHAYAVSWDPRRITEALGTAERVWPLLVEDMEAFGTFLDGVLDRLA